MKTIPFILLLVIIVTSSYSQNNSPQGQFIIVSVDTNRKQIDTFRINTELKGENESRITEYIIGPKYTHIRREWHKIPFINLPFLPKARYVTEGVVIKESKKIIRGELKDSIIYSHYGLIDSIKDNHDNLLWKKDFSKVIIGPCAVPIFELKRMSLKSIRKKKRSTQRNE